jgi:hypothetical protein
MLRLYTTGNNYGSNTYTEAEDDVAGRLLARQHIGAQSLRWRHLGDISTALPPGTPTPVGDQEVCDVCSRWVELHSV